MGISSEYINQIDGLGKVNNAPKHHLFRVGNGAVGSNTGA